jgi:DNA-binding SARP family transcriptional activator
MRAHSATGNRAEALRAYERCRKLLAEEMGINPSAQTEAVYLEILRSSLSSCRTESAGHMGPDLERRKRLTAAAHNHGSDQAPTCRRPRANAGTACGATKG